MREYPMTLDNELLKGLTNNLFQQRGTAGLIECLNIDKEQNALAYFERATSFNDASKDWGSVTSSREFTDTRDVTINVKDFSSLQNVEGAMVYIDGVLKGTVDANGDITVIGLEVGGHSIRVEAAGYIGSAKDPLLNDVIVVS